MPRFTKRNDLLIDSLEKTTGRIVAIKVINLVSQNDLALALQTYKARPFEHLC